MLIKCKVCGKEFEAENGRGRKVAYCSDECRRKGHMRVNTKAMLKRYHNDEEWRAKRIRQNADSNKRRREARKEQVMQELCEELYNAKSSGDIRAILDKKVRIRSELYA